MPLKKVCDFFKSFSQKVEYSMYPSEPAKGLRQFSKAQAAKVFQDFCESTSLHGYPYLFVTTSVILKIIWIIVIIVFTFFGIGFLISNTNHYLSSNIVTTIDTSSAPLNVSQLMLKGTN